MTDVTPETEISATWPMLPVDNLNVQLNLNLSDISTIGEGMDRFTQILGRFGVDSLALLLTDSDNPEREWILYEGVLMTVAEYESMIEEQVDQDLADDDGDDDDENDEDDEWVIPTWGPDGVEPGAEAFEIVADNSDHQIPIGELVYKAASPEQFADLGNKDWYTQGGEGDEVSIHPDDLKPATE